MDPNVCRQCRNQAVWLDLWVSLAQAVFKSTLGLMTGSMALNAHGLHSFADFLTKGITLLSVRVSSWPATEKFPYGYGKVQFLSATFVGISLFGGSLTFLYQNIHHINEGLIEAPGGAAVLGAIIGALTAELMYRYLKCVGERNNSPAIRAASWDNRVDALSSLAVLVGLLFAILGFPAADHIAAVLVSVLVVKIGAVITYQSIMGLLDESIPFDVLRRIQRIALKTEGVFEVISLRGRKLGEVMEVNLVVSADGKATTAATHRMVADLENRLHQQIKHLDAVHIAVRPVEV